MARVIIEFEIDNDAFESDFEGEVERILEEAKADILAVSGPPYDPEDISFLFDSNGNNVGEVRIEDDDDDDEDEAGG